MQFTGEGKPLNRKVEFAVRSKSFETYERFSKIITKMGWKYTDPFVKFFPSALLFNDCMYMSNRFDDIPGTRGLKFRFSNCDDDGVTLIFNLDTEVGFSQAVAMALTKSRPHPMIIIE